MQHYTTTLTIAGFDGSGGAGLQADLKTFSALGCYGMTVLTALPIQNTTGVKSIYSLPLKCIEAQLESIFEDIPPQVVKIGMLHTKEIIQVVAKALRKYKPNKVVVDPVMVAKSGQRLLDENAVKTLIEDIFPLTTILTPNIPEAEVILKKSLPIKVEDDLMGIAQAVANYGPEAVILKGGHTPFPYTSNDCLYLENNCFWLRCERFITKNTHGTGCTFSAALAAFLALGYTIYDSSIEAKKYISEAIKAGANYEIGHGKGPVNHFFKKNSHYALKEKTLA